MRIHLLIAEQLIRMGLLSRAYSHLQSALRVANMTHQQKAAGYVMVTMANVKRAMS